MRYHLVLLLLIAALTGVARADDADCWKAFDAAITHRATVALPPYISYEIRRSITHPELDNSALDRIAVTLRTADGAAKVLDGDFGQPLLTDDPVPGAPFLGPYGDRRGAWLEENGLHSGGAIAVVHAHSGRACTMVGEVQREGVSLAHLVITPSNANRPGIREVWIDAGHEFRQAVLAVPIGPDGKPAHNGDLVTAHVDTQLIGGNVYVRRLTYHSPNGYHVDYDFTGFTFPATVPEATFNQP